MGAVGLGYGGKVNGVSGMVWCQCSNLLYLSPLVVVAISNIPGYKC